MLLHKRIYGIIPCAVSKIFKDILNLLLRFTLGRFCKSFSEIRRFIKKLYSHLFEIFIACLFEIIYFLVNNINIFLIDSPIIIACRLIKNLISKVFLSVFKNRSIINIISPMLKFLDIALRYTSSCFLFV